MTTKRYELRIDAADLDSYTSDTNDALVRAFALFVRDFAPDATFTDVRIIDIRDARFGNDIAFTFDADDESVYAYAAACLTERALVALVRKRLKAAKRRRTFA